MGKSWKSAGKQADKGKQGAGQKGAKKDFVQKFRYLAKASLAPYPDEEGVALYLGKADDEKAFFKSGNIAKTRSKENCELLHRIGMAISLSASAFDVGNGLVEKRAPAAGDFRGGSAGERFSKTGLTGFRELLETDAGQKFKKAAALLNTGKTKRPDKKDVAEAMSDFVAFLQSDKKRLRQSLARIVSFSAGMYLHSMTLLEHMDMQEHPEIWARQMQSLGQQPKAVRAWARDPKDEKKMLAAMVEAFMDKVKGHKKEKAMKRQAADSSSDCASEPGGASSSAASSATESSGPKKQKGKKRSKRALSDSDSSASAQAKKKAKQDKSDDRDKSKKSKKTGKRSALSSSSSDAKAAKHEKPQLSAREVAFVSWKASDVSNFVSKAEEANMNTRASSPGIVQKTSIVELAEAVPKSVLDACPLLAKAVDEVRNGPDEVPCAKAKPIFSKMYRLGEDAQEFLDSQAGAGASSTGAAE